MHVHRLNVIDRTLVSNENLGVTAWNPVLNWDKIPIRAKGSMTPQVYLIEHLRGAVLHSRISTVRIGETSLIVESG